MRRWNHFQDRSARIPVSTSMPYTSCKSASTRSLWNVHRNRVVSSGSAYES